MDSKTRTPDRQPASDQDQGRPTNNADGVWGSPFFVLFWLICVSLALVVGLLNALLSRLYP